FLPDPDKPAKAAGAQGTNDHLPREAPERFQFGRVGAETHGASGEFNGLARLESSGAGFGPIAKRGEPRLHGGVDARKGRLIAGADLEQLGVATGLEFAAIFHGGGEIGHGGFGLREIADRAEGGEFHVVHLSVSWVVVKESSASWRSRVRATSNSAAAVE